MNGEMDPRIAMLRHALATIAYRGGKTLRGAPTEFANFRLGAKSRTPVEILAHVGDLMDWALVVSQGRNEWHESQPLAWDEEVARFFKTLGALDGYWASGLPLSATPEKLLQAPVADALTHIGQLAMLRRAAGAPIRGENYMKADIAIGRVGAEQPAPRVEFG
jgi:hypothetical protein